MIGFMIGRAYWRQGFASQSVAQAISLLDPSTKSLIATVDSENIGLIKALEKNRFVRRETELGMLKMRDATEYSYQMDRRAPICSTLERVGRRNRPAINKAQRRTHRMPHSAPYLA